MYMGGKKHTKPTKQPFVSVCTPTFNRRPFIPIIIQCFENQTYPRDRMEWIIVDDGTDKIEDLVAHLPYVRYVKYDQKLTLGKKRNITNDLAKGDILVYMDDDDYYPPNRVKHAVDKLKNSKALCAGSSEMFIYFKHINKMYKFGPYGPNHATAATFAFKKELLKTTRFNEDSSVAEERQFLKDYTIPFVQLDSDKSILVFSHTQNSFDKKELLKHVPNQNVHETTLVPSDFVKETDILHFFMEDINGLLDGYEPGNPANKPDVVRQLAELRLSREKKMQEMAMQTEKERRDNANAIHKITLMNNPQMAYDQIQQLLKENAQLQEQNQYLSGKIQQLIQSQIETSRKTKQ
jgi:hypothetical protein